MLEKMSDFFTARVDMYDDHMMNDVEGCREAYIELARLLPEDAENLLDLGCGTGLELDEIFKKYPRVRVTGIDLTQAMLDKLKEKYPSKNVNLVCGSYFDAELGSSVFDTAISFQTMHHFPGGDKVRLYSKIRESLKPGGLYIECDYMAADQAEEDHYFSENRRVRMEQGIPDGEFYHYDTPCTAGNQIKMFLCAGFAKAEKVWRKESTIIVIAYK